MLFFLCVLYFFISYLHDFLSFTKQVANVFTIIWC